MATLASPPTEVQSRTSVVAVAATSYSRFMSVFSAIWAEPDVYAARSVLVVGLPKIGLIEMLAPTTGHVRYDDLQEQANLTAQRAASRAAASLTHTIPSRHCVSSGWRDTRVALSSFGCDRLFVHRADVPWWRASALRRYMSGADVALALVPQAAERLGG